VVYRNVKNLLQYVNSNVKRLRTTKGKPMKITISVSELNTEQARNLLNHVEQSGLNGKITADRVPSIVIAPAVAAPAVIAPVAAPVLSNQANDDENDARSAADVSGEVDSSGLPWDERIHSGSKKKKSDGTWTARRNVREEEVKAVEAELRQRGVAAAPVASAPMVAPLAPAVAPLTAYAAAAAAYGITPEVVPAPVAAPVAPPAPAAAPLGRDYSGVLSRIQRACAAGKMDQNFISQHIVGGINSVPTFAVQMVAVTDMANRPDIVEYAHQILDVNGF
jgi:hypothetical protein